MSYRLLFLPPRLPSLPFLPALALLDPYAQIVSAKVTLSTTAYPLMEKWRADL